MDDPDEPDASVASQLSENNETASVENEAGESHEEEEDECRVCRGPAEEGFSRPSWNDNLSLNIMPTSFLEPLEMNGIYS
eukprot:scaffold250557_cov54-Attheya_sp.AAC.2